MSAHTIEKRYALFGGYRYYPIGSTEDLLGVFATGGDAHETGQRYIDQESDRWFEVVDLVTMCDSSADNGLIFKGSS